MPTSAKIVTRSETTSSVTVDNLNKGSALTAAEMDSSLINLRDSSWGLADDTSTVLDVTQGNTVTITGGTNITSTLSGNTLTVDTAGNLQLNGINITDNTITTNRSNDNLELQASGTGNVVIGSYTDTSQFGLTRPNGPLMVYEDLAFTGADRSYSNQRISTWKYANDVTNDSNGRTRISDSIFVDFNGYDNDSNASSSGTGPQITHLTEIRNTASAATAVVGNIHGQNSGVYFSQSGGVGSTLDCEDVYGYRSFAQIFASSGDTVDINDHHHFAATGWLTGGNQATLAVNNEYGYYISGGFQGTNKYAFYSAQDSYNSRIGGINLVSNAIQAADTNDDLKIQENGTGEVDLVVTSQSTVGAAGGASALPATPSGYIQLKINGTQYVLPYYARS